MIPSHLVPVSDPFPNPDAVVTAQNIRVTVLTSRLFRIEYSPINQFEDRPSQPFWFRNLPTPEFTTKTTSSLYYGDRIKTLEVSTPDLTLRCTIGKPITAKTLSIHIESMDLTWHYGDPNPRNLKGTFRTLDNRDGQVPLEQGLLSRDGWALIDDSNSLVFNETGWLEPRQKHSGTLDLYFFGYGHAYQDCIRDFRTLTGPVPLLPRWVLGNWWSRYWDYNQNQIIALIQEFQNNEVPLSVLIIDMDWHITKTGNQSTGWTGYTWNRDLFPDPGTLIRHIHERGLKTALNLHPAEGIHSHEEQYEPFARHMGIDPETKEPIAFDLADPHFSEAYFELLHHPQENLGLDFWWLDWQQGSLSSLPGLDPLWWLNHLHFLDFSRPRNDDPDDLGTRPFIFSRWGGLGNHRYPIGFSGDTVVSWNSLAYQPFFTATASNVCYGWWSHDIGGHMSGIEDPELYTRWVQYGVLSPIFRLHSTKNPYHERRPYAYDAEISRLTSYAMRLRHALIPYLYTMSWRDHIDGLTLVRPLYHLEPEVEAAYHEPDTYAYGSELIAAPNTTPLEIETRLSRKKIWLPDGDWFNFFTGEYLPGGHHVIYSTLADIPLFAKAGAIVPLAPLPNWGGIDTPSHLRVHIFPGKDNHFDLYDDDGTSLAYLQDDFIQTPFDLKFYGEKLEFHLGPIDGNPAIFPKRRAFELKFWGITNPDTCLLHINDKPHTIFPEYDANTRSLIVPIYLDISNRDRVKLTIAKDGDLLFFNQDPSHQLLETCRRLIKNFRIESYAKMAIANQLPDIIQDPALLARARPTLTDTQMRALLETITRTGVHRVNHTGNDHILLWNHNPLQDSFPVTYHLTVNQLWGYYDQPYHHESGAVPAYKVLHPPTQFCNNPWELRLIYGDILTVKLSST